jgi:HEXXH motif-containing protein
MSNQPVRVVEGHRVSLRLLDETFAGPVSATSMAELQSGQHSRRLLLLKVVRELVPDVDKAWGVLVAADRQAPDAVRQVLTYPAVGMWLVRVIRKTRGIVADDVPISDEMAYLGSVAAAAAIRAGVPAEIDVPAWGDRVNLPAIGQFETRGAGLVRLRHEDNGIWLDGRAATLAEPLRRHRSEVDGVHVWWTIDDLDPYRAFGTIERPMRLDLAEYDQWCGRLDEAWAILVRRHAGYAAELAQVGPVIVPVSLSRGLVASTSSTSFGAIVVAMPESAASLAETLVHELQHSKLNAVLDLVRLEEDPNRLCYAPWRGDPRPLPGLLHGIYAFTSVAEFWREQRHADPDDRRAAFKFLYHREQVRAAVRAVVAMPELTAFGRRLVHLVEERLAACDTEPVPTELAETVALLLAEHRLSWRLQHLTPPAEHVDDLTRRWSAGGTPPRQLESVLTPDIRPDHTSVLPRLLRAKVLEPDRFADMATDSGECALACGRHDQAAKAFAVRITANPDDDGAWVGLLAAMHEGDNRVPAEIVSETYRRLSRAPDPVTLANWFASG